MLLPEASAPDPELEAEGSLDPMGLYTIAERLGGRIAPGVRQRHGNPRFSSMTTPTYRP